ncbi:hypothetical protein [Niabella aquatica]
MLDENLPKRLTPDFSDHEVFTVRDKRWNGISNGELLKLLLADAFDPLMTFDKNLQHQQNLSKYTITVFVLNAKINQYDELVKLVPQIKEYLNCGLMPEGPVVIKLKPCYPIFT